MKRLHFFRKFLAPSVMNIVGLAIAFASSFVIITQVHYDLTYDRGIKDYDHIFRMEVVGGLSPDRSPILCKPASDIIGHMPHVESYSAATWTWSPKSCVEIETDGGYTRLPALNFITGFGDFISTFQPEMITGSTTDMAIPDHAILPLSIAKQIFGTADCVGKQFYYDSHEINPEPKTVAGVYRDFPSNSSIPNAIMMDVDKDELDHYERWGTWNNVVYIRVDDPQVIDQLVSDARMQLQKASSEEQDVWDNENSLCARPLADVHFSDLDTDKGNAANRTTMWLLMVLAIAIVAVAAINFTNFSLAEAPLRIAGINTRKVLGESTARLRWGLIGECVATCALSFLIGMVALAIVGQDWLSGIVEGEPMSHYGLMALWFALALVTGVIAGVYPSYYVTSFAPALVLKGSFGLSPRGKALRTALLCLQFVTAFALIIGICIMHRQMDYAYHAECGYDKDQLIIAEIDRATKYRYQEVTSELMKIAGVENVSYSQNPIGTDGHQIWNVGEGDDQMQLNVDLVDYNFMRTMGLDITEGRDFKADDDLCFIFNETARRKYPKLEVGKEYVAETGVKVVGFCKDFKFTSMHVDDTDKAIAFLCYPTQKIYGSCTLSIRVAKGSDRLATVEAIKKTLEQFSPSYDFHVRHFDELEQEIYERDLRFDKQVSVFSIVAIALSFMGVLCLTLFETASRRKEIGIRRVLGCTAGQIVWIFCRHYALLLGISFAIGAPLGYLIVHEWLMGFAVRADISPLIFVFSAVIVSVITLTTVAVTSLRATRINPREMLCQ